MADEAAAGLRAVPAQVSPKFFYDPLGSRLFDAITELAEYYPTRTEAAIFAQHGADIAAAALASAGASPVMVDLGAGNCAKAARLFGRARAAPLRGGGHLGRLPAPGADRRCSASTRRWTGRRRDWISPSGCNCRPRPAPARRWCSTRARASATSRPTTRCVCCARLASAGGRRRAADRRRPGQARGAARSRLRRRPRCHRGLQPEPAAAPEPAARRRFRSARLAPRGAVRRRAVAHRDAPRGAPRRHRALARR